MLTIKTLVSALALSAAFAAPALALEYPIGVPQQRAGMEIAAVYLQPVEMEPEGHMRKAAESDIHLEADRSTRYESVAETMSAARRAGLTKIGFVTQPGSDAL